MRFPVKRKKRQSESSNYEPPRAFELFGDERVFSSFGSGNKMGLSVVLYANKSSFKMRHNNHDGFKVCTITIAPLTKFRVEKML